MTTKRILLSVALAAALGSAASVAGAQSFPSRPIRMIVSFPPGGATDVIARTVGAPLGQRLGQNVVVDNRPGSNGNISAELAANARPDGHTLLLGSDSLFGVNPHLYSKMPVDLRKAFVPVTNLVTNLLILTVNPDKVPSKTLAEFIEFARKANPPLFYASIGNGSQHHIAMELLKRTANDRPHPCALQGRWSRRHRDGRRRDGRHVRRRIGGAAGALGQAARAGGEQQDALADAAGSAGHRRDLSRLRGVDLAGAVRPGRDAARDRRASCAPKSRRCCACRTSRRS